MICGVRPLQRDDLADTEPRLCKTPIFARSASAVIPIKKVQLTLIGSPLRTFQCTVVHVPPPTAQRTEDLIVYSISSCSSCQL